MIKFLFLILLLSWSSACLAQSTGNSFPTPNGQTTGGAALLVPCGPIVNGQPTMCPPGTANGLPVTCLNCSPNAPVGASTNVVSGTITTTNTFQQIIAQNSSRKGCAFQNNGSHVMYFTTSSSPAESSSFQIPPGSIYSCGSPYTNVISTDAIQVTGTSGDAFAGSWQ